MAISTYGELQGSVATWLGRDDLTSTVPDFIAMFEAWANRTLRARQMETSTDLTTSSGSATIPTDYLATRSVTWAGDTSRELEYVDPIVLRARFNSGAAGVPAYYTIEGSTFACRPTDDTTAITFRYYQKIPELSASAPTNWLLTAHPDLYLAGTLVEANAFVMNGEAALLWKARRDEMAAEITKLSNVSKARGAVKVLTAII